MSATDAKSLHGDNNAVFNYIIITNEILQFYGENKNISTAILIYIRWRSF